MLYPSMPSFGKETNINWLYFQKQSRFYRTLIVAG